MRRVIVAVAFGSFVVAGCVRTDSYDVLTTEKIPGPRQLALTGPRLPWVIEIEKRLRAAGFTVKRWASQHQVTELVSPTTKHAYNEASARVILVLNGHAPNTSMTRCMGGGYNFSFINAELIDVAKNEVIASYSNSGYSENCPPLSGSIFSDVTSMVEAAF